MKEKLPFSFRVLLLGEGSMRKELEVLAEQMGLSDTVVFLGNISNEDVKQYLYASELFLFASKSETQGLFWKKLWQQAIRLWQFGRVAWKML